jgi:hypothetical protein
MIVPAWIEIRAAIIRRVLITPIASKRGGCRARQSREPTRLRLGVIFAWVSLQIANISPDAIREGRLTARATGERSRFENLGVRKVGWGDAEAFLWSAFGRVGLVCFRAPAAG